jgi:hypothetical protein
MTGKSLLLLSTAALAASLSVSYAGPCTDEIDRTQARVDARLEALAAGGPSAKESSGALLHHQPTPGSIAAAESGLREMSAQTVATIKAGMERARQADAAGNRAGCEQALAEVQRTIGP